jgi:hypothetical protein
MMIRIMLIMTTMTMWGGGVVSLSLDNHMFHQRCVITIDVMY